MKVKMFARQCSHTFPTSSLSEKYTFEKWQLTVF